MRGKAGTGKSKKYTTVKEIKALATDQGWKKYDIKELKVIEQGVAKRARQVYTRMINAGVLSPAMGKLESSQGVGRFEASFTAAKGGKEATIRNISNYLEFMTSKSAGIKGAKKHLEKSKQTLIEHGVQDAEKLTYSDAEILWRVIDEYRSTLDKAKFYQAVEFVINGIYKSTSVSELMATIKKDFTDPKKVEEQNKEDNKKKHKKVKVRG